MAKKKTYPKRTDGFVRGLFQFRDPQVTFRKKGGGSYTKTYHSRALAAKAIIAMRKVAGNGVVLGRSALGSDFIVRGKAVEKGYKKGSTWNTDDAQLRYAKKQVQMKKKIFRSRGKK